MDKKGLIELTNKVYRLSILFPKKEPLRYKIREAADDILANYISWEVFNDSNSGFIKVSKIEEKKDLAFALKEDLEILKSYFNVAKWQNWVSYFDILEVEEKYDSIYINIDNETEKPKRAEEEIVLIPDLPRISEILAAETSDQNIEEKNQESIDILHNLDQKKKSSFDDRKEKIIEILGQKEKVQVWQVNEVFPDISKRTIRRDFVELLKQGLIERIGERSETFYKLKSQQS
ncbi:MAG: DeoR family transcriptional regulator [Candidatus Nealsonbacteria bacterium]|nr:DeoR family transcriptional regulator [Candidatus Nealsonbacteria bacterium]